MSSKRLVFEETPKTRGEVRNKNKSSKSQDNINSSKFQKFGNSYIAKQQVKLQSKQHMKQDRLIKARKLKRARENQRQFKTTQTFISHDDGCSCDCICYAAYFPDFTPSELKEMDDYYNSYYEDLVSDYDYYDDDCEYLTDCYERSAPGSAHYVSEVDSQSNWEDSDEDSHQYFGDICCDADN